MAIVGGFDIHRRQVTFDYLDTVTGQVRRGRITPACRETLRHWLERFAGREDVTFAVEGCTGWRFVVEELQRAGITALLAEPAETADRRGPKRRAKTDKADARHLRTLVAEGGSRCRGSRPSRCASCGRCCSCTATSPRSTPPGTQRIHATLFHLGVPSLAGQLSDPEIRARLATAGTETGLSPAGAQAVQVALKMMDHLETELAPVHAQIRAFARRQPGCKALARELYGVGPLVAAIIWAFLGDARRFSSSAQAVRHAGLDVTVWSSDGKGPPGHLSHRARRSCGGRCSRPATRAPVRHPRTTGIYTDVTAGSTPTGRRCRSPASSPAAPTTSCAASATSPTRRGGLGRLMRVEAAALAQPMHRGQPSWPTPFRPPAAIMRTTPMDGL